jgi:hypothetical protein
MPTKIAVTGNVTGVAESDAVRLAAYILRCNDILAQGPVLADGTYRLRLDPAAVSAKSAYGLQLVIAPSGASRQLSQLPNLKRVALERAALEKAKGAFNVPAFAISEDILKLWWHWCPFYCVSGTVNGPDGCAAPGAEVIVYTVAWTSQGYTKTPRATVVTAPDGTFTACFQWCSFRRFPCWPCWPIWWDCWPWWWDWDILHVINALEAQPPFVGPGPVETQASRPGLIRPDGRALMRGQGFLSARPVAMTPDAGRAALIRAKLANPRIRALFPWWWWCCDDPNILFNVSQNGNLIVNENPAIDTRWCLEDGSHVTLVGASGTSTTCQPLCPPESGFVWTNVGYIDVSDISQGYAEVPGLPNDYRDMAFAGTLDLYGMLPVGTSVAYYQVEAAPWTGTGNPARGGTPPLAGSAVPVGAPLDHVYYFYNADNTFNSSHTVRMGPFNQGGLVNLYTTPEARQTVPTPPGLQPFPPPPPGGQVYWDKQGLMLSTPSPNLIASAQTGAADLTVLGYDAGLNPVALAPDDPLTLMIDNAPITTQHINGVTAYKSPGVLATNLNNQDCPAYDVGPSGYVAIDVTVSDANGHLFGYFVQTQYGHGNTVIVTPPGVRGYVTNPLASATDPNYAQKSWVGSEEVMYYPALPTNPASPPPDCCYEFRIYYAKRVTNGYYYPSWAEGDFQTINLKFSS